MIKKAIFCFSFIFYLSPSLFGTEVAPGLERLDEGLYRGQKADGPYFYMQKVTEDNRTGWSKYKHTQEVQGGIPSEWMSESMASAQRSGKFKPSEYASGMGSFNPGKSKENYEGWVAFVSPKKITSSRDIDHDLIEMSMAVHMSKGAPFFVHMGISRSFTYLKAVREYRKRVELIEHLSAETPESRQEYYTSYGPVEEKVEDVPNTHPQHSGISSFLHAFSAKVMLAEHPELLYMITTPLENMRQILKNHLPEHTYIGDRSGRMDQYQMDKTDKNPPIYAEKKPDGDVYIIYAPDQETVLWSYLEAENRLTIKGEVYTGSAADTHSDWFLGSGLKSQSHTLPFISVDAGPLANSLRLLTREEQARQEALAERAAYKRIFTDAFADTFHKPQKKDRDLWKYYSGVWNDHGAIFAQKVKREYSLGNPSDRKSLKTLLNAILKAPKRENKTEYIWPLIAKLEANDIHSAAGDPSALLRAVVVEGDIEKINRVLDLSGSDLDVNETYGFGRQGMSILHYIASEYPVRRKSIDHNALISLVRRLIQKGADKNAQDFSNKTPYDHIIEHQGTNSDLIDLLKVEADPGSQ